MGRLTRVWAAGTLLCMLVAACGQTPAAPPAADASSPTSPAQAEASAALSQAEARASQAASGEAAELVLAITAANPKAGAPPDDWNALKILRETQNIDLQVQLIPGGADGEAKLNADAAADNLPDMFQISNRNMFYQFADQGLIAPVDSILSQMPSSAEQRFSDPALNRLVTIDDQIFGFQKRVDTYRRAGLYVRQDWLDKLGLAAPTTLDEFLSVAKAFTEQDPDGNGQNDTYGFGAYIGSSANLGGQFDFIYGAYGLPGYWKLGDAAGFGATVKDPAYQPATAFINQLVTARVIDPDWPTLKYDDFRARAKQGKYGLFVMDSCAIQCELNWKDFEASNPTGKLAIIDVPKGPQGHSSVGTFSAAGPLYVVSQRAVDDGKAGAIARLWEWIDTAQGYDELIFGTEGVNFTRAADGAITAEGVAADAAYTAEARLPHTQLKFVAARGSDDELRARYPTFTTAAGDTINPREVFQTAFDQPWTETTALLLAKPAANQADIDRYLSEHRVQFALGQKELNDTSWQEFVAGLDGLGLGDYEASVKQTLVDAGALK